MERKLARIAGRSHGVVTRAELVRAGLTPEEVKQRVRRGTLLREHRGVYRVGHRAPSMEAGDRAFEMLTPADAPSAASA